MSAPQRSPRSSSCACSRSLAAPRPAPSRAASRRRPADALYQKLCSQCHGEKGDGQGIAAPRLLPRPRDFTAGKFKIRHTPSGALPTDDDLRHIIREGMPYTSMPAWPQLSDAEIDDAGRRGQVVLAGLRGPGAKPTPIAIPKAPAFSEESAKKGKEVYAAHRLRRPATASSGAATAPRRRRSRTTGATRSGPPT